MISREIDVGDMLASTSFENMTITMETEKQIYIQCVYKSVASIVAVCSASRMMAISTNG